MAAILRILLLLLPLVAVVMWLRWRMEHAGDAEALGREFNRLRKNLIVIAVAMAALLGALWLLDDDRGAARMRYVPPHTDESGKVVPGHFEPADSPADGPEDSDDGNQP